MTMRFAPGARAPAMVMVYCAGRACLAALLAARLWLQGWFEPSTPIRLYAAPRAATEARHAGEVSRLQDRRRPEHHPERRRPCGTWWRN